MVIITLICNPNGNMSYPIKSCRYVGDDECAVCMHGNGVDYLDTDRAYRQKLAVQKHYGIELKNPLLYFILAFDDMVENPVLAIRYGYKCAEFFNGEYQVLWSVHQSESDHYWYHIHMAVNSVNLQDGRLLHASHELLSDFCEYISDVTKQEVCGRIRRDV